MNSPARMLFPRVCVLLIPILAALSPARTQESKVTAPGQLKQFTVDEIFVRGKFSPRGIRGFQWIENGKAYSYLETDTATKQTSLWKYDVASGKKTVLVEARQLVLTEGDKPFSMQNSSGLRTGGRSC
jgi:hypothetical protein